MKHRDIEGDRVYRLRLRKILTAFLCPSVFLFVFSLVVMLLPLSIMPTKWRALPVCIISAIVSIISVVGYIINNSRLEEIKEDL